MPRYLLVSTALCFLSCWTIPASAIDRSWDDGAAGKNWIASGNWFPDGAPQNVDDVSIGAHPSATDDTVMFGVFPPYMSTVFTLELSFGADLDLNSGRLVVIEDTVVGGGFGGGTLAELIVGPVEGMNIDALNTNTLTINNGGRLRMSGGSISVDGTGASEGVLRIEEGGSVYGYGAINLDDDNVPDFVDMLLNDGTIYVGDPDALVIGEPPGRTLTIRAPNAANMGLMDINGDSDDGQVVIYRNSTLELNVRQINTSSAGDITLYGNSTLDLGVAFGVGNAPMDDFGTLHVLSGETDGIITLPAAPAVITGEAFHLAPRGRISQLQPDAELRFESEFVGLHGSITNNGVIHFVGDARIEADVTFSGSGALVNHPASTLNLPNGVDADTHLENAGELEIGREVQIDSFSQTSSGTLEIQIANILPDEFDALTVEGNAMLGGGLVVELTDGFEPVLGNSFPILETMFGNVSGTFDEEVVPTFNDLTFQVVYTLQSVVLEVVVAGVPGDYNQDGHVNAADYVVWRNNNGSGTSLPNDDTPGVGPDDYDRWVMNFGQSAGSGTSIAHSTLRTSPAPVPEPRALALSVLSLLSMLAGRSLGRNARRNKSSIRRSALRRELSSCQFGAEAVGA